VGPRLGDKVLEVAHLSKAFGDRLLLDDVSFSVPPGVCVWLQQHEAPAALPRVTWHACARVARSNHARRLPRLGCLPAGAVVGIVGGNGAGKSTLFKMIMGLEAPDSGSLELGDTVVPMYVDQSRDALMADKSVSLTSVSCCCGWGVQHAVGVGGRRRWCSRGGVCSPFLTNRTILQVYDAISGGFDEVDLNGRTVNARAYCSWYNFRSGDQQKKVGVLSGAS
jgi:ATPase subunit of ABC transporter with duplicated ATPase domains